MRIAFIRHGPTPWNESRRIQGRTDIPLGDLGRERVSAWRLPAALQANVCYVSPLDRAQQTAALLGLPSPLIEPSLIEMHWGEWEGETLGDLRKRLGRQMAENEARGLDFRPPGGESPREVQHRVLRWCRTLPRDNAVAVTHKGVIRAVYAAASGWDMRTPPGHKLAWQHAHVFRVRDDGRMDIAELNIELC